MADRIVPAHIGIIMDGNGRWAKQRGLARTAGHTRGADVFKTIAKYCQSIGVKALTAYAFSTENWKRSENEVSAIMGLLGKYLDGTMRDGDEGMRIRFIGRRDRIAPELLKMIEEVEQESKNNSGMILNIALDYGGRDEIIRAVKNVVLDVKENKVSEYDIDEELFNSYMDTADCPPVDFIIRPSGEQRLSNFLLWQCAYSEFIFMDTLWPDFTTDLMDKAIDEFNNRSRRYGA